MARPAEVASSFLGPPTAKCFWNGTHRSRHPADTWAIVEPQLSRFGITRVGDVTGLDRIGIPVFMAIRPNARALAVSQGKGADSLSAKVSAVMEAIELYHAERTAGPVRLQSYDDLCTEVPVVDPFELPLIRDSVFSPRWPVPWVEGFDLMTGSAVWVPFELVHANATVPPIPGSGCFDRGTNGLASGNTRAEAVLHGLCEVIERDALAMWEITAQTEAGIGRLNVADIDDEGIVSLHEQLTRAGVHAIAWEVTSDLGIPAFEVLIFDDASDPLLNPRGGAFGAGCHPDPFVALGRAITESAQSRLTAIAGSRDDLRRADYGAEQAAWAIQLFQELRGALPSAALPMNSLATGSVEEDVVVVLDRLRACGVDRVVVVDLSITDTGVSVVRVIVPGLEGPTQSTMYRPGRRALARAAKQGAD